MQIPPAIEHIYYMKLYTTHPEYAGNDQIWLDWSNMTFSTAIRNDPHGTNRAHRIRCETEPWDRWVKLRAEVFGDEMSQAALKATEDIVLRVAQLLDSTRGQDEATRAANLAADPVIKDGLITPVAERVAKLSRLRDEEKARINQAALDTLAWLTDGDFTAIKSTAY